MSKMVSVSGSSDYKLLIDFEDGSNITFNMQKLSIDTILFSLRD